MLTELQRKMQSYFTIFALIPTYLQSVYYLHKHNAIPGPRRRTCTWSACLYSPHDQTLLQHNIRLVEHNECSLLSTHSVHQIVHAGEVRPHADLELVHGLLAADGVEACAGALSSPPTLSAVSTRGTLASLKNVLERRLEQTVAHLIPAVS